MFLHFSMRARQRGVSVVVVVKVCIIYQHVSVQNWHRHMKGLVDWPERHKKTIWCSQFLKVHAKRYSSSYHNSVQFMEFAPKTVLQTAEPKNVRQYLTIFQIITKVFRYSCSWVWKKRDEKRGALHPYWVKPPDCVFSFHAVGRTSWELHIIPVLSFRVKKE